MKRFLLILMMVITANAVNAEFNRLVFHTLDGEEQSIGLNDLNISFENGELLAISEDESLRISLNSLNSMEFANEIPTGIGSNMVADKLNGEIAVYTPDGSIYGIYNSISSAFSELPAGVYIFKSENGNTAKILINP